MAYEQEAEYGELYAALVRNKWPADATAREELRAMIDKGDYTASGILLYKDEAILVPYIFRPRMIREAHEMAGHMGVERTTDHLK
jgi:hypothetical protein